MSVESFARKMLCQHHNNSLSPLDAAAAQAFETLRKSDAIYQRHTVLPPYKILHFETLQVRARPLERWMLKTAINFANATDYLIGNEGTSPGVPPAGLVRICFGVSQFKGKAGMYVAAAEGEQLTIGESIEYHPVLDEGRRMVAALFELRGLRFVLGLDSAREPDLQHIEGWSSAELLRPFRRYTRKAWGRNSHVVEFDWSE